MRRGLSKKWLQSEGNTQNILYLLYLTIKKKRLSVFSMKLASKIKVV